MSYWKNTFVIHLSKTKKDYCQNMRYFSFSQFHNHDFRHKNHLFFTTHTTLSAERWLALTIHTETALFSAAMENIDQVRRCLTLKLQFHLLLLLASSCGLVTLVYLSEFAHIGNETATVVSQKTMAQEVYKHASLAPQSWSTGTEWKISLSLYFWSAHKIEIGVEVEVSSGKGNTKAV